MERLVESCAVPTVIILSAVAYGLIRGIGRRLKQQDRLTKDGADRANQEQAEGDMRVGSSGNVLRGWIKRITKKR